MKTKYIFLLITIAIIAIVVVFPHQMLSSGNLYEAHSDLKNNCLACHTIGAGTPDTNCISCHKVNEIGTKNKGATVSSINRLSFHNNLNEQSCISCHAEHKGVNAKAAIGKFDHILLSETSRNECVTCHNQPNTKLHSQVSVSCATCHTTRSWRSGITFNHVSINEKSRNNCVACHQSPKDNFHSTATTVCSSCHGVKQWKPSTFNHSSFFILDQNHNTDCTTCHTQNNLKTYTCFGCHEHSANATQNEHREEGITNINNCVRCHKSANEDENTMDKKAVMEYNKSSNKSNRENDDD